MEAASLRAPLKRRARAGEWRERSRTAAGERGGRSSDGDGDCAMRACVRPIFRALSACTGCAGLRFPGRRASLSLSLSRVHRRRSRGGVGATRKRCASSGGSVRAASSRRGVDSSAPYVKGGEDSAGAGVASRSKDGTALTAASAALAAVGSSTALSTPGRLCSGSRQSEGGVGERGRGGQGGRQQQRGHRRGLAGRTAGRGGVQCAVH